MKKVDNKKLIFYIAVPLIFGSIVGILTSGIFSGNNGIVPTWIFPVVWTILYILMGISSYLVSDDKKLMNLYKLNLLVNLTWSFIFFTFNFKILAFLWILFLIAIVIVMIYKFYKKNKLASYLLIPYLIWLILAAILNLIQII